MDTLWLEKKKKITRDHVLFIRAIDFDTAFTTFTTTYVYVFDGVCLLVEKVFGKLHQSQWSNFVFIAINSFI